MNFVYYDPNIKGSAVHVDQPTYGKAERPGIRSETHHLLNHLFIVTFLLIILGIITFGEDFSFRKHALSYFGRIRTPNGNPNIVSLLVFSAGLVVSAGICLNISRITRSPFTRILFVIGATGYLIMITPCDLNNTLHSIGAGMVFGSLWMVAGNWLIRLIPKTGWIRFTFYQLILQGTIFPYAWFYFTDHPDKQFLQKIALTGLILVLKIACLESGADGRAKLSDDLS